MRKNKKREFMGSEAELTRMTRELDEMHNDIGMPAMWDGVERVIEASRREEFLTRESSRRTFLLGASAAAVGGTALLSVGLPSVAGAVSRSRAGSSGLGAGVSDHAFPPANLKGDLAVAAVAASLENLAVFAYTAGLAAATAGKLGTVPPAVATFATTAKAQHTQHATAWNSVLKANGKAKVTVTNPSLTPTVKADFAKVTTIPDLANLALLLEIIAAETYQAETSKLMSKEAIGLSASSSPLRCSTSRFSTTCWASTRGFRTRRASPWPLARPPRRSRPWRAGARDDGWPRPWRSRSASRALASSRSSGVGASTKHDVIEIKNFMYSPMVLKVNPGAKISVVNKDSVTHTLSAVDGKFNTGDIKPGATKTFTAPKKPGTYHFICMIHQFMKGSIIVK